MDKIKYALQLALDCTYADTMMESAKNHLRFTLTEALKECDKLNDNKPHVNTNFGDFYPRQNQTVPRQNQTKGEEMNEPD